MMPYPKKKEKLSWIRNKLRREHLKKRLLSLSTSSIMKMVPIWSSTRLLRNVNARLPSTLLKREKLKPLEVPSITPALKAKVILR